MVSLFLLLSLAILVHCQANFAWNCANSRQACINACFAVQCGNANPIQTRGPPGSSTAQRKRAGCAGSICNALTAPHPVIGPSCDEFPFASSTEGGDGAYLRCIPAADNYSQGGQLSGFFVVNGVVAGGQYYTFITNSVGLRYCDAAVPGGCANDGQQFHTVRLLNKRGVETEIPMLVPDPVEVGVHDGEEQAFNVTQPSPMRKFVTSNNIEIWLLGRDVKEDFIGKDIWFAAAERAVKIQREIPPKP
ncbi:hypothetical protein HFD88_003938 [Aspergillus terreus]|nr:hypothetical protein HFD88_003938 [Aspergillus terreus]